MRKPDSARAGLMVAAGAAAVGLAAGLATGLGRRVLNQAADAMSGDWRDTLTADHLMLTELFETAEATVITNRGKRRRLAARLRQALDRHAFQEENVIYPALRLADPKGAGADLVDDHAELKTLLFVLERTPADEPRWLVLLKQIKSVMEAHAQAEEETVFPRLRGLMNDEQDAELTALLHRTGAKLP